MSLVFRRHLRKRLVLPILKHPNVEKISDVQFPVIGDDRCRWATETIVKHQRSLKSENRWLEGPLSGVGSRQIAVGEDLHISPVCPQVQRLETVRPLSGVAPSDIGGGRLLTRKRGAGHCRDNNEADRAQPSSNMCSHAFWTRSQQP